MKRKILTVFFLAAFCLMAFQAGAEAALYIKFNNDGYPNTDNYSGWVGGSAYSYKAGVYGLGWSGSYGGPYTTIEGFCVERQSGSFDPNLYTLQTITDTRQKMAAWLANEFVTGGLDDDYTSLYGTPVVRSTLAAATQTAIWELILDTGDKVSPTDGNTYTYNSWAALAQNLVNSALTHGEFDASGWRLAQSATFQDLLIPNVPIPGAVWLLGSGLIGLVAIRRRFKK